MHVAIVVPNLMSQIIRLATVRVIMRGRGHLRCCKNKSQSVVHRLIMVDDVIRFRFRVEINRRRPFLCLPRRSASGDLRRMHRLVDEGQIDLFADPDQKLCSLRI